MKPLDPDARSLIDAASEGDEPTAADAARVRAKLAARLALATAAGAATTAASTSVAASSSASAAGTGALGGGMAGAAAGSVGGGAKLLLVMALVGAAATTGAVALRSENASSIQPPAVTASSAKAPAERVMSAATANGHVEDIGAPSASNPAKQPVDRRGQRAPSSTIGHAAKERLEPVSPNADARKSKLAAESAERLVEAQAGAKATDWPSMARSPENPSPKAPANDTVAEEAALLRSANVALAHGDSASALTRLDEHTARFPRGALAEERQATRVLALCASGRQAEARALASSFVEASPRSPLAPRVRRACAEPPKPGP